MPTVAFPFVEVQIDTSALAPVAQRAPGVIAIVGKTPAGSDGGTGAVNTPFAIDGLDQAAGLFAKVSADGTVAETKLFAAIKLALLQDPRPSKLYGIRVEGDNYAAALSSLEAADDVTFVALAGETAVGAAASDTSPATNLLALKDHVEAMSAEGQKRLGVAMIDPAIPKSSTYVHDVVTAVQALKSDSSRMILVAARGATGDAATAAMAAMAGFQPQVSMVLKRIRGLSIPVGNQYGPSEIRALAEQNIDPIIDPDLIPGEGLHFAEGRCFTTDESLLYIDLVRVLDDIEFRLKAGLIGSVGDARITKFGMTNLKTRVEGILGPLQQAGVIADFSIEIPVLNILALPDNARTATDTAILTTARAERTVDVVVTVTYGPAVHRLKLTLKPKF
ncbi:MAG TPA: hypothetical protein VKB50_20530 [Vicinamibacterales bacterium]|nr:hypothetical protein [Vicinamibacterales bacterium]